MRVSIASTIAAVPAVMSLRRLSRFQRRVTATSHASLSPESLSENAVSRVRSFTTSTQLVELMPAVMTTMFQVVGAAA